MIEQGKGISGRARERERDWEERGELTVVIGIERRCLQGSGAPMSRIAQLGGALLKLREGE
jgi:hypothetical protein